MNVQNFWHIEETTSSLPNEVNNHSVFFSLFELNKGLGGLSLLGEPGLQSMNAALNISNRAYAHMQEIHKRWRNE